MICQSVQAWKSDARGGLEALQEFVESADEADVAAAVRFGNEAGKRATVAHIRRNVAYDRDLETVRDEFLEKFTRGSRFQSEEIFA